MESLATRISAIERCKLHDRLYLRLERIHIILRATRPAPTKLKCIRFNYEGPDAEMGM